MTLHAAIVKQLYHTPMSLAELQANVQASMPTLRKAVQELTEVHWIRAVGQGDTNGGRPAMLFGPDDSYYLLIGVHLQLPGLRIITWDLSHHIVDETEAFQSEVPRPDQVVQTVTEYVQSIRDRLPDRQILGIGVAAPGFTDPESGDIISIGRVPEWHNFPICSHLGALLELPVRIANDVDCMAFAEFRHTGISFAEKTLAYVGFDEGVKFSLFLTGELYKGSSGNAGLVITDLLNLDNHIDRDVYRQILTINGLNAIFTQKVQALDEDARQPYAHILAVQGARQRLQMILAGWVEHLPVCTEIVEVLCATLSTAIASMVLVIQPDTLVIGGALSAMPLPLMAQIEQGVRRSLPTLITHRLIIQQARLSSPNSAALGAVTHWLQDYLANGGGFTVSARGRLSNGIGR